MRIQPSLTVFSFLFLMGLGGLTCCGQDADSPAITRAPVSYNRDVRPLLAEYCFACHGTDEETRAADLRLDLRNEAIDFGAIEPGSADDSQMISRILSDDPDVVMPPPETKKKLSEEEKQILIRWIDQGAEYQNHWSLEPPQDVQSPEVSDPNWIQNPIDQFVLARLDQAGLQPAPPADPASLFRRLHFDITGLPPQPDDVLAFIADYQQDPTAAVSRWIDELMQSPAWGEHRARYWLDAARYADTHGMHFDNYREMWPYRDWVIDAFNKNQPFDQFIVEQLAGDLLPNPSTEQLIATGFGRCNMTTNEGGTIDAENLALYSADRVQTFGWVFLGLTTNCAQCHDHKFDSFSMKDYYSLAAFFRNIDHPAKDGNRKDGRGPTLIVPTESDTDRWEELPDLIEQKQAARVARRNESQSEFDQWLSTVEPQQLASQLAPESLRLHVPLDLSSSFVLAGLEANDASLTPVGDLTFAVGSDGTYGSAAKIAKDSTIELGDVGNLDHSQPFTVSAWIRPSSIKHYGTIVAKMDEEAEHRGWDLQQEEQKIVMHLIDRWSNNAIKIRTKAKLLKADRWHHVTATYDGSAKPSGFKLFVDGVHRQHDVLNGSLTEEANTLTNTPLRIGQRSNGLPYEGQIRDLQIAGETLPTWRIEAIAKLPQVKKLLAVKNRNAQQNRTLHDFYLAALDRAYRELTEQHQALVSEQTDIQNRSPITHIQREKATEAMTHMLIRGEYDQLGDEVKAATPEALHPMTEDAPRNRLGLANWVVDPANPLTARVTVNRFWQEIFGRGIVPTPEDFGVTGAMPSHPELLDFLAIQFQNEGWDVKAWFKMVFTSATYQQAAITTDPKLEIDRDNSLLSRGPRFRMDAEMIRDSALSTSGLLSRKMYGPGVKPYQPEAIWDVVGLPNGDTRNYVQDSGDGLYRRTLYNFWKRMAPPPSMETFGAPNREVCVVKRERTNTPLQALVTLNDEQFMEAARVLATRVINDAGGLDDSDAVLNWLAARLLSREWTAAERSVLDESWNLYRQYYLDHPEDAELLINIGEAPVDKELDTVGLAAWTMLCNQTMNLDEVLNK